ncbi:DUF2945 domain-containing protein [Arthrobacter sp. Sa2BUA2]|uniref:DUF2945 domain-containing protein n=1 Tax=Arthrobacter pullicola TaxID=2762224 RepID=A0ABR8YK96_9MICC|nr:DUF2945 domain-containing protein [Arthrobacter pullicola]MBD8044670.1 DUF2945 domain-containing protein [Arthrobacter pullicola]
MSDQLRVGDRVRWNSRTGAVTGEITEVHTSDFEFMGRRRLCSETEPQYKVRSDATQLHAVHRAEALRRVS